MNHRVTLRAEARVEYAAAARWYENEKPGLGDRFVASAEATFAKIAENPLQFAEEFPEICCAPVDGFRYYCVYYKARPRRIDVLSVFHTSRNPQEWQSRV